MTLPTKQPNSRERLIDDPFAVPMLFLRIGWMRFYEGQSDKDQIYSGAAFVRKHGFGHEMFNFRAFNGHYFGYVRPTTGGGNSVNFVDGAGIKIERIASDARTQPMITGVLAVWVSCPRGGETVIVGWYRNATVYRKPQAPPKNSRRVFRGEPVRYYISAAAADVTWLDISARPFAIPIHRKGGMGQSNVWYADDRDEHRQLRSNVLRYVQTRVLPATKPPKPQAKGASRQTDPLLRCKVEQAAVAVTTAHFKARGFSVRSQETDNLGWDLAAKHGARELRLEVKGLSGNEICVELTPNEFAQMQKWRDSYCVCVVTNALTKPRLAVFEYSPESGTWQDDQKRTLDISPIVAARCRVK